MGQGLSAPRVNHESGKRGDEAGNVKDQDLRRMNEEKTNTKER